MLYILYKADLRTLSDVNKLFLYADDTNLIVPQHTNIIGLNNEWLNIKSWADSNKLILNTNETEKRAYYQNYCIDSNQILHSDKDHQMPFVCGHHTRITNRRWRTAAILEKSKNCYISAAVWEISTKFGTIVQFNPFERPDR